MSAEKHILTEYLLRLADNSLIIGHRLSEWCGFGPVLEQDIAMTNISLDQIGLARMWYQYAGEVEGKGHTEDDLAYHRDAWEFRNLLLVEQPNGDFAHTIARHFYYDAFNYYLYEQLALSKDKRIAAIAAKGLKEVTYHLRYSSDWVIRLGDGTAESHERMQKALEDLWMFTGELTTPDATDMEMLKAKSGADLAAIHPRWLAKVQEVVSEATLRLPTATWMQQGGKKGIHSEHLGHILAELQFVQRAYPGMEW
jgi:ring-1,2-phenylacetyl-CoA epoxidase subunit PaaC